MISKKHKLILTVVSVILLLGTVVAAVAVVGGKKPSVVSGGYESLIADRIEIRLENTDFVLEKSTDEAESFTFTFFLTMKKTQADFYAVIDSLQLEGIACDNIVFTALNEASKGKAVENFVLPAENGESLEVKWQIDVTCSFLGKGEYDGNFRIVHTTGVTAETAVQKITEIPMSINVE